MFCGSKLFFFSERGGNSSFDLKGWKVADHYTKPHRKEKGGGGAVFF